MDKQLSTTKIGDQPTSLNMLNQGVNGHKFGFDETNECSTCGEQTAVKKCSACKMVHYCSPKCQKLHWFTHKKFCKQLAEEYIQMEKIKEEAKKLEEQKLEDKHTNGETQNQIETDDTGAKPKTQTQSKDKDSIDDQTSQLDGHPEPTVTSGLEGETGPDFQYFLNDPDITGAFEDPEVAAALSAVNEDPANITKYQDNEKLIRLINIIPEKLKAYQSSSTTLYVRK